MGSTAGAGRGSRRRWVCGEEAGIIWDNESVSNKQTIIHPPPIKNTREYFISFDFLLP